MEISTKYIPMIFFENKKVILRMETYGKIPNYKKLIFLFKVKFVGEFVIIN